MQTLAELTDIEHEIFAELGRLRTLIVEQLERLDWVQAEIKAQEEIHGQQNGVGSPK